MRALARSELPQLPTGAGGAQKWQDSFRRHSLHSAPWPAKGVCHRECCLECPSGGIQQGDMGRRQTQEAVGQALLAACTLKPVVLLDNVHSPTGTGGIQAHRPRCIPPLFASHELLLPRLKREVVLARQEES